MTERRHDTDRRGLVVLSRQECLRLLESESVGRLGFVHEGTVDILPVNFLVHEGAIYFRTTWGSKLQAVTDGGTVAFEIDRLRPDSRTGWSVLARATARLVEDPALRRELAASDLQTWAPISENPFWIVLQIEEIGGREIRR